MQASWLKMSMNQIGTDINHIKYVVNKKIINLNFIYLLNKLKIQIQMCSSCLTDYLGRSIVWFETSQRLNLPISILDHSILIFTLGKESTSRISYHHHHINIIRGCEGHGKKKLKVLSIRCGHLRRVSSTKGSNMMNSTGSKIQDYIALSRIIFEGYFSPKHYLLCPPL